MNFLITLIIAMLIISSAFSGCKNQQPSPTAKTTAAQQQASQTVQPAVEQAAAPPQETMVEEGYVYQPRDRRDPFIPLIVSTQKWHKKEAGKVGTLESYDISEFVLSAIAEKGGKYFALLVTPDNRSFTVSKGTIIGFNKGRVEEITRNKVVLVEYSKDYRGDTKPKQITLEFLKER